MVIRAELFLHFRDPETPIGEPRVLELPDRATVRDVLSRLDIPGRAEKVVLVDGRPLPLDTPLRDGQTVTLFPPLEGG